MALSAITHSANASPLYFYPAGAWNLTTEATSCKISSQYNNGFIISLHKQKGVSNQFESLITINFRQPAFDTGQAYNATINLNGHSKKQITATATSNENLSINISHDQPFLNAILSAPTFNFLIENNDFNFSLVGLKQNAHSFIACSNPHAPKKYDQSNTQLIATQSLKNNTKSNGAPANLYDQIRMQTGNDAKSVLQQKDGVTAISPPDKKPVHKKRSKAMQALMAHGVDLYADTDLDIESSDPILNNKDWTLEQATMRFQEAERQLKNMGTKLQKERAKCGFEKKELEALLFDPQLTSEQQLAKLASMEEKIRTLTVQMKNQELRYKERIKILEDHIGNF